MIKLIEVTHGDITKLNVDAIVNAANTMLLGGGGVDGAIHDAAGPHLFEECWALKGCEVGKAKITKGYNLPVKHVIHAVGPVYRFGKSGEPELLKSAYENSLALALENKLETISFPCISTGAYMFPKDLACDIAWETVSTWMEANDYPKKVVFCCYEKDNFNLYKKKLNADHT